MGLRLNDVRFTLEHQPELRLWIAARPSFSIASTIEQLLATLPNPSPVLASIEVMDHAGGESRRPALTEPNWSGVLGRMAGWDSEPSTAPPSRTKGDLSPANDLGATPKVSLKGGYLVLEQIPLEAPRRTEQGLQGVEIK